MSQAIGMDLGSGLRLLARRSAAEPRVLRQGNRSAGGGVVLWTDGCLVGAWTSAASLQSDVRMLAWIGMGRPATATPTAPSRRSAPR